MSMFLECAPYVGLTLALVAIAASANTRRFGDPEGVQVTFTVMVSRQFIEHLHHENAISNGSPRLETSSRRKKAPPLGLGLGMITSQIAIIGGDTAGKADIFRKTVKAGDTIFTITLRPGRTMMVAVQADGGGGGWESLGSVTIPDTAEVHVTVILDTDGVRISLKDTKCALNTGATDAQ